MKLIRCIMLRFVAIALIWTQLLSGVNGDTLDKTLRKSDGHGREAPHREYNTATPMETEPEVIFQEGMNGYDQGESIRYNTTRIPALVYYQDTFFAFAEGRRETFYDVGVMDIILRRGQRKDWNVEWGPTQVIAKQDGWRLMDPVPIIDSTIGAILLLYNAHPANMSAFDEFTDGVISTRLFIMKSFDLGESWTEPQELNNETVEVIKPKPDHYGPSPGHGIRMKSGRIIVAGKLFTIKMLNETLIDFSNGSRSSFIYSNVIYSDDHGENWQPGGSNGYVEEPNGRAIYHGEGTIVELDNGRLCLNSRTLHPDQPRLISFCNDNGESFCTPSLDWSLLEPGYYILKNRGSKPPIFGPNFRKGPFLHQNDSINLTPGTAGGCQGSMIGFPAPYSNSPSNTWVIFSNPANIMRINLAVKLSVDGCQTWSKPWILHPNASAYSDMAYFETWNPDTGTYSPNIVILYEASLEDPTSSYETIQFKMFNVEMMLQGQGINSSMFLSPDSNHGVKNHVCFTIILISFIASFFLVSTMI